MGTSRRSRSVGLPGADCPFSGRPRGTVGRQVQRTRFLEGTAEQFLVRLPRLVAAVQPEVLQIDLVLKLKVPLRRAHPDGPGRGGQRGQDTLEVLSEKVGREQVQFREPRDFLEQSLDLSACLFDCGDIDVPLDPGMLRTEIPPVSRKKFFRLPRAPGQLRRAERWQKIAVSRRMGTRKHLIVDQFGL